MPSEFGFEPRSPRFGPFLVLRLFDTNNAHSGPFLAIFGPFLGHMVTFFFSKVVPRQLGMLKQVFLARFELVVTLFGPWKIPECFENGPFWDKKSVL